MDEYSCRTDDKDVEGAKAGFFYTCWQRMLDLIAGLGGLLCLGLLLPFLAPVIYLDSPGPLFYSQERVGYRGKVFLMHKLRSMRVDAESTGSPIWSTANDPRITRVGRFLRATHLDELPQAINILRGEMSLVGPRPERPPYVAELEKENRQYRARFQVKPGITGWAQVKCGYGNSYHDELLKLQYDLYYIEHRSCSFDLLILGKTFVEVLLSRGNQ
jgi:lipopolysaccharide/colanic/teichoic acid biosynthesis glycosyltransferase